ncbi:UDP-glycosyltransferase 91C1, partial [Dendrobium catenatum]|uniref:UDP-glycosyltransferase 91C1 n=1 Tax=Dendrobium catenatum TaxID=906689 RepID=UPI0010A068F3
MEEEIGELHIIMVPWLAMGHLLPFFELSKSLALKGLQISFFTTPSNIHRLPPIPKTLTPLFKFIPCSSSTMNIENTSDLHYDDNRPLLSQTYDALEHHLVTFLSDPSHCKPNWIIYDIIGRNWAPALASRFNVNSAFFNIFSTAAKAFLDRFRIHDSPEKIPTASDLIPFPTTVTFRRFEALRIRPIISNRIDNSGKDMILTRTFKEFEAKWIDLLGENCIPVGFLTSSIDEEESETWMRISEWLDKQKEQSVIYVGFGAEAILTREQIDEVALGLEKSELPFLWVLRVGLPPEGFVERTAERGLVWMDWVPQSRLLAHRAIGGFLTHGGWGSVVEGMVVG